MHLHAHNAFLLEFGTTNDFVSLREPERMDFVSSTLFVQTRIVCSGSGNVLILVFCRFTSEFIFYPIRWSHEIAECVNSLSAVAVLSAKSDKCSVGLCFHTKKKGNRK